MADRKVREVREVYPIEGWAAQRQWAIARLGGKVEEKYLRQESKGPFETTYEVVSDRTKATHVLLHSQR